MGQNKANPLATILSATMMLEYLSEKNNNKFPDQAAQLIENAIEKGFEKIYFDQMNLEEIWEQRTLQNNF